MPYVKVSVITTFFIPDKTNVEYELYKVPLKKLTYLLKIMFDILTQWLKVWGSVNMRGSNHFFPVELNGI